jgi:hypothetical protein
MFTTTTRSNRSAYNLAEILTGSNIRFYYTSGDDVVKVR